MHQKTDAVALSAELIRCPSVTPENAGALEVLEAYLSAAGFECHRADRGGISNLFARWGARGHPRTFGFNGHTDVVPVGDASLWTVDPFSGVERDGCLWGRGATDMKTGVAAFAAAAVDFVSATPPDGAVVLAITGDEEGLAKDGTVALLDWMDAHDEAMTACLVGEPTCPERMGEMIKIGRRGSMTAFFEVAGTQGHSAYPHRARNPVQAVAALIDRLSRFELDSGTAHFDPTTLAATTIDVGNPANNVIPATARATVNIRFNDSHTSETLTKWLEEEADKVAGEFDLQISLRTQVSGESFLTPPGPLSTLVSDAVEKETGIRPELSTTGGTSDARFIKDHCTVVEFGLVGKTMHKVDEHVPTEQIRQLKRIYESVLKAYFA
ncbi:MAG: succinyl-diaminopimelate desuccinylase [Pseudomonadota bacterium]